MDIFFEFHDSRCLQLNEDGIVVIDAYVHHKAEGVGGYQLLQNSIRSATVKGNPGELLSDIYDGILSLGGKEIQNGTFPFRSSLPTKLNLTLADDARTIEMTGTGVTIDSTGPFRFVEALPLNMS